MLQVLNKSHLITYDTMHGIVDIYNSVCISYFDYVYRSNSEKLSKLPFIEE